MLLLIFGGVGVWLAFFWWVDRASHPLWQVRNGYRLLSALLMLLLLIVGGKALLWHQELVFTLLRCR